MKMETMRGYLLAGLAGIVILAAGVLVIMNSGNTGRFHLYVKSFENFSIAWLMTLSAVGGVLLYWMFRLLLIGTGLIRRGKLRSAFDQTLNASAKPAPRTDVK